MAGIELSGDKTTQEPFAWEQAVGADVCAMRLRGDGKTAGNVIVLMLRRLWIRKPCRAAGHCGMYDSTDLPSIVKGQGT